MAKIHIDKYFANQNDYSDTNIIAPPSANDKMNIKNIIKLE